MADGRELSKEEIAAFLYDLEYKRGTALERMQKRILLVQAGILKDEDPPERPRRQPKAQDPLPRAPTPDGRPRAPISYPVMVWMKDVEAEGITWLWPQRFAQGKIAMLVGDPGLGKSQVTTSMAAIISSGGRWPDLPDEPVERGSVLIMNAEDNLADTLKPRLEWAGADMSRIASMTTVRTPEGRLSPFSIGRDLPTLDLALSRMENPRLVIIDPVTSFLGGADEHKSGEVREAIDPMRALAEKYNVCLQLVNHFNKGMGAKALYRSMGSIAFTGAARTVWAVTEHPKRKCVQVMAFVKSNISAPCGGLAFVMNKTDGGRFNWLSEPVPWTANEVMGMLRDAESRGSDEGTRGPRSERIKAVAEYVVERLQDGACKLGTLTKDAFDELGASRGAVVKALDRLKGKVRRFKGDDGLTWLELEPELPLEGGGE